MKLKKGKVKMKEYILQIYNSTRLNKKCKCRVSLLPCRDVEL